MGATGGLPPPPLRSRPPQLRQGSSSPPEVRQATPEKYDRFAPSHILLLGSQDPAPGQVMAALLSCVSLSSWSSTCISTTSAPLSGASSSLALGSVWSGAASCWLFVVRSLSSGYPALQDDYKRATFPGSGSTRALPLLRGGPSPPPSSSCLQ